MSIHQITIAVFQLIDESCRNFNKDQCMELLQDIKGDIEIRLETFEDEDEDLFQDED